MANPVFSPIKPHFFQPLLPGFHKYLTIPVAFFMRHMKGRNEQKAVGLRSDGWEGTWEVKMDGRRFTDGWEEFAAAHDFQVGDFLIFRHEGDLVFHVTAFGPSGCQIKYAPFHSDDVEDDIGNVSRKKKAKKNPKTEADPSDHTCFIAFVTASGLRRDTLEVPKSFARRHGLNSRYGEIVLMNIQGRSWRLDLRTRKLSGRVYIGRGWRAFCRANRQKAGGFCRFKLVRNGATPVLRLFPAESGNNMNNSAGESPATAKKKTLSTEVSNDGTKSSGEASNAKEKKTRTRWRSLPGQNRFVTLTLTPYCARKYKLRLPRPFTKANGLNKPGQKITLLDKDGREWPSYLQVGRRCGQVNLGKGWRDFCTANLIKEGESFTLELMWEETNPILKFCSKVKTEQQCE